MIRRTHRHALLRIAIPLGLAALLTACSSVPREHTSPCACDWRPLTQQTETTA